MMMFNSLISLAGLTSYGNIHLFVKPKRGSRVRRLSSVRFCVKQLKIEINGSLLDDNNIQYNINAINSLGSTQSKDRKLCQRSVKAPF